MNKLQPESRSALKGYLLIIVCQYSIIILFGIIESLFKTPEPAKFQDVWWAGAIAGVIGWVLIIGIPVAIGDYFARVSYVGVAFCMVFSLVIPLNFLGYYFLSQLAPGGTVTMETPWYTLLFPSLLAVIALYVWRYISNHSNGSPGISIR